MRVCRWRDCLHVRLYIFPLRLILRVEYLSSHYLGLAYIKPRVWPRQR